MNLQELLDRKGRLANEAQGILTAANGNLSKEQEAKFDAIHADIEGLNAQIERVRKQDALNVEMNASQGRRTAPAGITASAPDEFAVWAQTGARSAEMVQYASALRDMPEAKNGNAFVLRFAASGNQNVANNAEGGYTVQNELMRNLEEARKAFGGARQFSTSHISTSTGAALPIPTNDDTSSVGELVAESGAVANLQMTFAQVSRTASKWSSKAVTVSLELLQDSAFDFAAFVGRKLGERIGRAENPYFTTGTGSAQPQGLITGAHVYNANVVLGSAANTTYDLLVDIEHSVDPAYRQAGSCGWSFNDSALKAVKKLKDTQNRPIWVPGLTANAPDTILGYSYVINTAIADPADAAKSIVFGDRSKFVIRDVRDIVVLRLNEIAALSGQVVFVAFARSDSFVLDAGTHPITVWQQSA